MFPSAINTPRTLLRKYHSEDSATILKLLQANRERLVSSFPATYIKLSNVEKLGKWLEEEMPAAWENKQMYPLGLWHKQSGDYFGQVTLRNIDHSVRKAELGYYLSQDYEGRGLMSEVLASLIEVAFDELELNRLYVRIMLRNKRSVRLIERCGFRYEGTLRQDFRSFFGNLEDVMIYGLLREEY
ncbi:MAG: GNAT family N-acetyltransferase [Salibacteraceae bacterium]